MSRAAALKAFTPEAPAEPRVRFIRFLPYWAVLQTDIRLTYTSWVFRLWVILALVSALGYGLYKVGIHREAGIVQSASVQTGDLLRGVAVASLALIALISVSAISSERNNVADSILSRGISRYQYFLAKWHARTLVTLCTFAAMSAAILTGYHFLLDPDLTLHGGIAVTLVAVCMLAAVVAWGVTIGALSSNTLIGITIFWMILYGAIVLCSFLPDPFPSPSYVLAQMRSVLRGSYDVNHLSRVGLLSLMVAAIGAIIGTFGFAKKDI